MIGKFSDSFELRFEQVCWGRRKELEEVIKKLISSKRNVNVYIESSGQSGWNRFGRYLRGKI